MFEKFMNAFMAVFMVVGLVMLLLVLGGAVYQAAYPNEVIQRQDKACHNGCKSSHNPDLCYQACMYRK